MALNVKIEHAVNQLKRKNGMLTVPCRSPTLLAPQKTSGPACAHNKNSRPPPERFGHPTPPLSTCCEQVHGSFITEAHLAALDGGAKRKWANVSMHASKLNEFNTGRSNHPSGCCHLLARDFARSGSGYLVGSTSSMALAAAASSMALCNRPRHQGAPL